MAVVAVGNVDRGQVMDWASQAFDDLEPQVGSGNRTPPVPLARFNVFPREDKQAYVGMGFPGLSAVDPDRFAQRMLATVLGVGTSSRLFQEIRERSGLVYEIYASSGNYTDCGSLSVFYNTAVKDQEKVARLVAKEIARLKTEGLENGELKRSKHLLKGAYVRRLESTEARMVRLGEMFMAGGEAITPEETLRRIDEVTEESVLKAAERLLMRSGLAIAMHAPKKESEAQARNLADLDF
jgi:predicted Zn-dependent peptidase